MTVNSGIQGLSYLDKGSVGSFNGSMSDFEPEAELPNSRADLPLRVRAILPADVEWERLVEKLWMAAKNTSFDFAPVMIGLSAKAN